MNSSPISIRLPEEANHALENLAHELHTTKTQLIRDAILERAADYLDSKKIDRAAKRTKKTYTMKEMKARHGVEG